MSLCLCIKFLQHTFFCAQKMMSLSTTMILPGLSYALLFAKYY